MPPTRQGRVLVVAVVAICVIAALTMIVFFTSHKEGTDESAAALVYHKPFSRLPRNVLPESYNITLRPDLLGTLGFTGSIAVNVKVFESTWTIKLDCLELNVSNVLFVPAGAGSDVIRASDVQMLKDEDRVLFTFEKELPTGDGVLSCDFRGILNENLHGFYRTKNKDVNGSTVYYAATQFEAMDARRAFPCWDEPAIKATFNVTLIVQHDFLALSNMLPLDDQPLAEDHAWRRVRFATTPRMSTYLVAVVVGKYDFVERYTDSKVRVRIYTPVGRSAHGAHALDAAVRGLHFFEDYFGIPYPLPKADFVAIADFAAGAMENWGLILGRETGLLFDPVNSSAAVKQNVVAIVTHELAHMWFGNLVTMEWWTYLWLNEGFARFMENFATKTLYPEYEISFAAVLDAAFSLDSLDNSHPVEVPVEHPARVDEIFDEISYEKGASVILMINNYLGETAFRKGIQHYLRKHMYSNTLSSDLWLALEDAVEKPVKSVMNSWVQQVGFPVIEVTRAVVGEDVILNLTQEKFYSDVDSPQRSAGVNTVWQIPVSIAWPSGKKEEQVLLMKNRTASVTLKKAASASWIQVNDGAASFFRTMYPEEMLRSFMPFIANSSISTENRYMLIADLFALVQSGYRSTTELFKFALAYNRETDYWVWTSISGFFSKMNQLFGDDAEVKVQLEQMVQGFFQHILKELQFTPSPKEKHTTSMLRGLVLMLLAVFKDKEVLSWGRQRFEDYISRGLLLPPDLRSVAYVATASTVDTKTWNQLIKLHTEAISQEEMTRISNALGHVPTPEYLKKVLEYADSPDVRSQDALTIIGAVATSPIGRELAWEHFKANHERYTKRFKSGFFFANLIKSLTQDFNTFSKATEVQAFFSKHPVSGTELTVKQSVENIISNAKWVQRDGQVVRKYLSDYLTQNSQKSRA